MVWNSYAVFRGLFFGMEVVCFIWFMGFGLTILKGMGLDKRFCCGFEGSRLEQAKTTAIDQWLRPWGFAPAFGRAEAASRRFFETRG
jgi:hypothetical protein